MKTNRNNKGFSLTEVLMASGILAVGLLMVAGTFPVAIHLSSVAAERTIGAVAADEAFAKIRLYGVDSGDADLAGGLCADFGQVITAGGVIEPNEFLYPSDQNLPRVYNWSALCRKTDAASGLVQVTVFVSRKIGAGLKYNEPAGGVIGDWPVPVKVNISLPDPLLKKRLNINNAAQEYFIGAESTIVDDATGWIYRVLERDAGSDDVILDKDWQGGITADVWVIPPPVDGGKNPCIAVYQQVIRF